MIKIVLNRPNCQRACLNKTGNIEIPSKWQQINFPEEKIIDEWIVIKEDVAQFTPMFTAALLMIIIWWRHTNDGLWLDEIVSNLFAFHDWLLLLFVPYLALSSKQSLSPISKLIVISKMIDLK